MARRAAECAVFTTCTLGREDRPPPRVVVRHGPAAGPRRGRRALATFRAGATGVPATPRSSMTADTRVTGHARHATGGAGGPAPHRSHPRLVLVVLAAVVLLDQATKWWAWRHLPGAVINPGGDQLVGPKVGTWYSEQLSGAVLDLQGAVVLALAVSLLVRIRRRVFGVPAAMAVAGWSSNALDRLGLHF